jgi:hypothetical protein
MARKRTLRTDRIQIWNLAKSCIRQNVTADVTLRLIVRTTMRSANEAVAVIAAIIVVGACSAAPAPTVVKPAETTPPEVIDLGRETLKQAGIAGELRLVASEPTEWRDSSLGCPRPDAQYAQVITPGYTLNFAEDGKTHEVHVAGRNAVICPSLMPFSELRTPRRNTRPVRAQQWDAVVKSAREDLSKRLGVPLEEVTLQTSESAMWLDEKLGCEAAGAATVRSGTTGGTIQGFKLYLTARGLPYTYHTDFQRAIACPPIEAE